MMHIKLAHSKLLLRPFQMGDTTSVRKLLSDIMETYGFSLDIQKTDTDYADIGRSYADGEFWVCIDPVKDDAVVGTVAFRPARWTKSISISNSNTNSAEAELRRLYLAADYRGTGLGAFLLAAIEYRAFIAGYTSICLESAAILKAATKLYTRFNYQHTTLPGDTCITKRCDIVMNKKLSKDTFRDFVSVLDGPEANNGNVFALVPLKIAERCGVPFRRV